MKTYFTKTAVLVLAILLSACGDDDSSGVNGKSGETYVRLEVNGTEELNVTGSLNSPIVASLTVEDNGALPANTVQIGASVINEAGTGLTKTLSISLQDITATGTYKLLEHDGIFVYAYGNEETMPEGYTVADADDGTCTFNILEISNNIKPGIGKAIKGTFSATVIIDDAGNTATLTGEFNGGV